MRAVYLKLKTCLANSTSALDTEHQDEVMSDTSRYQAYQAMSGPRIKWSAPVFITQYSPLSAEDLRKGLATLPQELYDTIYNLTFSAADGVRDLGEVESRQRGGPRFAPSTVEVFRNHEGAPFAGKDSRALLQVDRASRAQFAASYYGGLFLAQSRLAALTWVKSVAPEHRALVREMWVMNPLSRRVPSSPFDGFEGVQYAYISTPEIVSMKSCFENIGN